MKKLKPVYGVHVVTFNDERPTEAALEEARLALRKRMAKCGVTEYRVKTIHAYDVLRKRGMWRLDAFTAKHSAQP